MRARDNARGQVELFHENSIALRGGHYGRDERMKQRFVGLEWQGYSADARWGLIGDRDNVARFSPDSIASLLVTLMGRPSRPGATSCPTSVPPGSPHRPSSRRCATARLHAFCPAGLPIIDDPVLNEYIDDLGQRLLKANADGVRFPFTFFLKCQRSQHQRGGLPRWPGEGAHRPLPLRRERGGSWPRYWPTKSPT